MKSKIPCTVGMLGWNNADVLERSLKTLKNFEEIILADGGSSDNTLEIAEKYGIKVIKQSTQNKPITDFSKERNLLLNNATQPWFLWIDPDEYVSEELVEEIRKMIENNPDEYKVYNLRISRVNPFSLESYIDLRSNYQIRLFSTKIGGRFGKRIHEKFYFDSSKYKVGYLNGCWYTPIDKLDFKKHKTVVDRRFKLLVKENPPRTFKQYIKKAFLNPTFSIIKIILRIFLLRIMHPTKKVIPLALERNRIYTQILLIKENTLVFFKKR